MSSEYKAIALTDIRNTHGDVEIDRGEIVTVTPTSNPGMVLVKSPRLAPCDVTVPAS